ncbi:MAG: hypothetical protein KDJ43_00540, partial [Rhizobiaceae bacterium]|nr:hypothetical protein [Rhizobiaceae bacterium]
MNWQAHARTLRAELAIANSEIAGLRKRLGETSIHARRVERAYLDAMTLAALHVAHEETTRRAAEELAGITNNRWENARALLMLAKLHNDKRWLVHDLAVITERLEQAKALALAEPAAYGARLPKHARP